MNSIYKIERPKSSNCMILLTIANPNSSTCCLLVLRSLFFKTSVSCCGKISGNYQARASWMDAGPMHLIEAIFKSMEKGQ